MWNESAQTMPRAHLVALQEERLRALLKHVYEVVPFYRQGMDAAGVTPSDVVTLSGLARVPFLSKYDMRDLYPYGLFAVPKDEMVEIHMSSGTTGTPVVGAYTRGDLEVWGDVMARTFNMGGTSRGDVVQVAYGYGLFTGGFGAHYGAQTLGAMAIPMSSGNSYRQLQTIIDFSSTVIACTPSYALFLAEYARENGVDLPSLSLRNGFFGAEPWSEGMRAEIEERLGLTAFDIYGLTEVIGPGVAAECAYHNGLHVFEDHFYPEIVDPETGTPLPDGEKGELVLTTLTRQGTPVVRYRTRDITYLMDDPCPCGRTARRIHRLMGRTDDMLIIRGVNVFPQQIEEVLLRVQGVAPHYRLIVDRQGALDSLHVEIEMSEQLFSDEVEAVIALERRIEAQLKAALGLQVKTMLVNPKTIERSEGKAKRVIDRRAIKNHV